MAAEQRKKGYDAISYCFSDNLLVRNTDIVLNNSQSYKERLEKARYFAESCDLFHFYFGNSLLGESLSDVPILYRNGKKIFFQFCGCDIRNAKWMMKEQEFSACKFCKTKSCNPKRQEFCYRVSKEYGGEVNFVSTPDLLPFVERSVVIPQAIDIYSLDSLEKKRQERYQVKEQTFRIVHAPTDRSTKGTFFIEEAVENLRKKGLNIELILIENMSRTEAFNQYCRADFAIDQILAGWYGTLSAELMALSVPTACFIDENYFDQQGEKPPLINLNVKNIEDIIEYYYRNREELIEISKKQKDYVNRVHHPEIVADLLLQWYEK